MTERLVSLEALFPYGEKSFIAVRKRIDEAFKKHPEMKERDLLKAMVGLKGDWTLDDAVEKCLQGKQ